MFSGTQKVKCPHCDYATVRKNDMSKHLKLRCKGLQHLPQPRAVLGGVKKRNVSRASSPARAPATIMAMSQKWSSPTEEPAPLFPTLVTFAPSSSQDESSTYPESTTPLPYDNSFPLIELLWEVVRGEGSTTYPALDEELPLFTSRL